MGNCCLFCFLEEGVRIGANSLMELYSDTIMGLEISILKLLNFKLIFFYCYRTILISVSPGESDGCLGFCEID